MATLSRGQTFGTTEQVTNTKLHNLVDLGTISGIALADFAAGVRPTTVSTGAPGSPTSGDLWFDTTLNLLRRYDGAIWVPVARGIIATAAATLTANKVVVKDQTSILVLEREGGGPVFHFSE